MSQFSRFITQGSYPEIQVAFFQTLSEKGGGGGGGMVNPNPKVVRYFVLALFLTIAGF